MTKFAVRIELNGPPPSSKYDDLHDAMLSIGLVRKILGDDGNWYQLPDAVYIVWYDATDVEIVRNFIKNHVDTVWLNNELIVFRYDEAAWELKKI